MTKGSVSRLELRVADSTVKGRIHRIELSVPAPGSVSLGDDQVGVEPGSTVTLTATLGGSPEYTLWRQVSGPVVTLSGAATANATFTAPATLDGATLVFGFRVWAGGEESEELTTTIKVQWATERIVGQAGLTPVSLYAVKSGGTPEPVNNIASDTFGRHDAVPRDVPGGFSWRFTADTDPSESYTGFTEYGALNVWGQCFAIDGGSGNYNVRIQSRDPRLYFFDGSDWTRATLTPGDSSGAFYTGDFTSSTAAINRSDGGGAFSVPLSTLSGARDAYHWWWDGMYPRIAIPDGCQGILCRMDIRLIPDDGYATTEGARFIATCDADLFATTETTVGPGGMNPGLPEGRMKWVTGEWQRFYNTTLDLATLTQNPPEIED